jgi:hypothetical protein
MFRPSTGNMHILKTGKPLGYLPLSKAFDNDNYQ